MKEKVRDFIYLGTDRYISFAELRTLYWKLLFVPAIIAALGILALYFAGISYRSLIPLCSIVIWSWLYWKFVAKIKSDKTPKTFELRFLVNGVCGSLLSFLFWIVAATYYVLDDKSYVGLRFSLLLLLVYFLFTAVYIALLVLGVHKGVYKRIREKSRTPKALAIASFFASLIPCSGVAGMYSVKILKAYATVRTQTIATNLTFVMMMILPAVGNVNFLQYYYCKKYGIHCDEYGDTTSPRLKP